VMHRALTRVAGCLFIEMDAPGSEPDKHVPRATKIAIECDLGAKHVAPPCDGFVDIRAEQMRVMDVFGHDEIVLVIERGKLARPRRARASELTHGSRAWTCRANRP
jgi:hypothetical protein